MLYTINVKVQYARQKKAQLKTSERFAYFHFINWLYNLQILKYQTGYFLHL